MENLDNTLDKLVASALSAVEAVADASGLDEIRVQFLGKKGELTSLLKALGQLSPEERPKAGGLINKGKQQVQDAINQKKALLDQRALDTKLASEAIDVSLAGRGQELGTIHPITRTMERITDDISDVSVLPWSRDLKSKMTTTTSKL